MIHGNGGAARHSRSLSLAHARRRLQSVLVRCLCWPFEARTDAAQVRPPPPHCRVDARGNPRAHSLACWKLACGPRLHFGPGGRGKVHSPARVLQLLFQAAPLASLHKPCATKHTHTHTNSLDSGMSLESSAPIEMMQGDVCTATRLGCASGADLPQAASPRPHAQDAAQWS